MTDTLMRYDGTPGAPRAFIVDLDGTVALGRGRGWLPGPDGEDLCGDDEPNEPVVELVQHLAAAGLAPIYITGRTEACRGQTTDWLARHIALVWGRLVLMRAVVDDRPDHVVKAELFDAYVRDHYDVRLVLDDRDSVVAMWRAMGLTCLQVAPGDF